MDKQQTALQIRGSVLEFRGVHSETWKTPSDIRCLQFAVTECGEALDEYIRLDAQWFRTNPREAGREEVLLELADCLMMLLSISGKDEKQYEWFSFSDWSGENEINDEFFADLLIRMSNALSYYVAYKQVPFWFVYSAVSIILAIDEDWPFLVQKRLDRIEGKINARSQERRESQQPCAGISAPRVHCEGLSSPR